MLFDDKARTKLDSIIQAAALGETVGILATRMSDAERAEKLTPEGIVQLSRESDLTSMSAELLKATIDGLEAAHSIGSPSNLEFRVHLHHAYRQRAISLTSAHAFRHHNLQHATTSNSDGSFTSIARGASDGMLRVAPIGVAFAGDPGRAFHIGAEAAALTDGDFDSYLGAGVVSLIVALRASGLVRGEAIYLAAEFIESVDWSGEISGALRGDERTTGSEGSENAVLFRRNGAAKVLRASIVASESASSVLEVVGCALIAGASVEGACLAGQLAAAV